MGNICCADDMRNSIDEVVFKTVEPREKEGSRLLDQKHSVTSDVNEPLNYDEIDKHNVLS